jgi:hypothetical protein
MKILLRGVMLVSLTTGLSAAATAGELRLSMQDGLVTIIARDVPLRQILQEWARIGNTKIVNAEKVPGAPLTLELVNIPERQALDTLLRSAAGYMAAPRAVATTGASVYDRIMILAVSHPPPATASVAPPPFQPRPQPMPVEQVEDDDDEPANMPMPMPNPAIANPALQNPALQNPALQQNPAMQGPTVAPFPGAPPQPGQVQTPPVLTAPRPGALPVQQTPEGVPNPYQPSVVRPVGPGGPGGPGDEGAAGR